MRISEKYLICNMSLTVVAYGIAFILTRFVVAGASFPALFGLVASFLVLHQMGFILLCRYASKGIKIVSIYSLIKGVRFLLLVAGAVVYCATHVYNIKPFLITFCAFYIVWLIFDTLFVIRHSKEFTGKEVNELIK